jgi:hypothetical protein
MGALNGWVFQYNEYRERWEGTKREHYFELFNGDQGHIVRSNTWDSLISLIIKSDGDFGNISKIGNDGSRD